MNLGLPRLIALALALFILTSTQTADAQAPTTASRFGFVFEPSIMVGASHWRERWHYVFTDGPPVAGEKDRGANAHVSPAGEFGLMLGARLGEHVRTGGYVRLGCAGQPSPFIEKVERSCLVHLGAQLTLSQKAYEGFYALGRFGGAFHEETGWSAGGGLGYAFRVKGAWHLGLGVETTYTHIDSREQGDHGYYEYGSRAITSGLAVRMLYRNL